MGQINLNDNARMLGYGLANYTNKLLKPLTNEDVSFIASGWHDHSDFRTKKENFIINTIDFYKYYLK